MDGLFKPQGPSGDYSTMGREAAAERWAVLFRFCFFVVFAFFLGFVVFFFPRVCSGFLFLKGDLIVKYVLHPFSPSKWAFRLIERVTFAW